MKILVLTRFFPDDPVTQRHGVYGRLRMLIEGAAASGADVHVLYFTENSEEIESAREVWDDRLCDYYGVRLSFSTATVEAWNPAVRNSYSGIFAGITNWLKQDQYYRMAGDEQRKACNAAAVDADLILVHKLPCMVPVLASKEKLPPVFFDLDDIEHVALARALCQPPHWYAKHLAWLHLPALRRAERLAVRRATRTFVCSALDVEKLSRLAGSDKITELPNSVAMPSQPPTLPETFSFLFIGTYAYRPNARAAEWMIGRVWPLIRTRLPSATLTIAGNQPELIKQFRMPPEGVAFPGFVRDLNELYAAHRAVVCPIQNGGGTRVKLIEAAAYARPAVSTTVGAEGLVFAAEEDILLADTPHSFADLCIRLMTEPNLAESIASSAYASARKHYDREAVVARLGKLMQSVMHSSERRQ